MKRILSAGLVLLMVLCCAGASAQTLYVDNQETDKVYPERLNMRAEPSRAGDVVGLYYTGTPVEVLSGKQDGYVQVEVGGVKGYMSDTYLITMEEAQARYGEDSSFGTGREAEIDLTGLWKTQTALREAPTASGKQLTLLSSGQRVEILGILETDWAYIAVSAEEQRLLGYVPLDELTDVGERKILIVEGVRADSQTMLYSAPTEQAKPIMAIKNGTTCFSMFGRTIGQWRKVRVGGVTGWIRYTQTDNLVELEGQPRSIVPYYPLQMQTKTDALLYSVPGDKAQRYMTLGRDMKVEVLCEQGSYVYVRTLEGGMGTYASGDYGYMAIADLKLTAASEGVAVAQADCDDLPVLVMEEPSADSTVLGALCPGAQVRIVAFTQTDYVQVQLGTLSGYMLKDEIRILAAADSPRSDRIPQRAALTTQTALREKPDDRAKKGESVDVGKRVYVLGVCGDWAYVQAAEKHGLDVTAQQEDHTGFVPLSALNASKSSVMLIACVKEDKVNLRSDSNGPIVGKVHTGELLRVAQYGSEWTCVVTPDAERGYVKTEYLTFEAPAAEKAE